MRNVTKQVVMTINLTPDQWQLFTASMDCAGVAKILNNQFNHLSKRGVSRAEFESTMDALMSKYSKYGASDSEPRYVLEELLDEQFA